MQKKRILVLNGGHSEIPLILSARALGFHVITSGNSPQLIGHKLADEYSNVDFSDQEEIYKLACEKNIDAICSSANDFGALSAAYVAEKMGLPGHDSYETAALLHHKDSFKKLAMEIGVPTTSSHSFEAADSALKQSGKFNYPVMVKPIDLTGGKGISKVDNLRDIEAAINRAFSISRKKRIVIEEYFEGTQHSFSTFIKNGRVVFHFSDNEYSYINPYLVSSSASPATGIERFKDILLSAIENIAGALKLCDGVFHVQYLANDTGISIIEVTRRCSGDLYPLPVMNATGVDWARCIVSAESGLEVTGLESSTSGKYVGRHCLMAPRNGSVEDVIIHDEIRGNISDKLEWWEPGYEINDYLTQKLGIFILNWSSQDEMLEKIQSINELVEIKMSSGP